MKRYVPLSEIRSEPVGRLTTGFDELDFMYGFSTWNTNPSQTVWGIPFGSISLWAGESGTGKSRLAIGVAVFVSQCYRYISQKEKQNLKVLYFQTESELQDFAGWVKDSSKYPNIFCSGENKIDEIIDIIYEVKPNLIFIDSVNEIEEFSTKARRLINGEGGKPGLKKACKDIDECNVILLGQLNQDGSIKGGTSLPHLVDIAFNLTKDDKVSKSVFDMNIGSKHRYGRRDDHIKTQWLHIDLGVISFSANRLYDEIWCKTHNIPVRNRDETVSSNNTTASPNDTTTYSPKKIRTGKELKEYEKEVRKELEIEMRAQGLIPQKKSKWIIPFSDLF
jgi:predicted ATP-dependent serine protease